MGDYRRSVDFPCDSMGTSSIAKTRMDQMESVHLMSIA